MKRDPLARYIIVMLNIAIGLFIIGGCILFVMFVMGWYFHRLELLFTMSLSFGIAYIFWKDRGERIEIET